MTDVMVYLIIAAFAGIIIQAMMYKVKKSRIETASLIEKKQELMSHLDHGHLEAIDASGRSILMIACAEVGYGDEFMPVINRAIAKGIDVNKKNLGSGNTALHELCQHGFNEMAYKALQEAGCDPSIRNKEGQLALHLAIAAKEHKAFDVLISQLEDMSAADNKGNTLLHYGAKYCQLKIVDELLEKGANPAALNEDHQRPGSLAKEHYEDYLRTSGNSAHFSEADEKYNHNLKEMVRKLELLGAGESYKYKKYKRTSRPDMEAPE